MVDMAEHMKKMCKDFEALGHTMLVEAKTPAADHSFKINENCNELNNKMKQDSHTFVAKRLFGCKQGGFNIHSPVAFLTMREMELDKDDWKKIVAHDVTHQSNSEFIIDFRSQQLQINEISKQCFVCGVKQCERTHRR